MLSWLDDQILKFFTKISHKFQKLTGKTNYFLAKTFLFAWSIAALFVVFDINKKDIVSLLMLTIIISVSLPPIIFLILYPINKTEESFLADPTIAPLPLFNFGIRVFILMLTFCSYFLWGKTKTVMEPTALFILWVCFIYFASVIPLPPGKSKIREWIESFSAGFRKMVPARSEAH